MNLRKIRQLALLVFLIPLSIFSFKIACLCAPYQDCAIHFSQEESFCEGSLDLTLSTLISSEIYYTLDGSDPSQASTLYEEPIHLAASDGVQAFPVRAIAYYADGSSTDIYTKTYFVGEELEERFSTWVVSLVSDPEGLYDYENGILVEGKTRDDYLALVPDADPDSAIPANYRNKGMEYERAAHVEIWTADGSELVDQDLSIRVHGGVSRGSAIKSFRLIARSQYGQNRLTCSLDSENDGLTSYKRLILRNHGNDLGQAFLRNELGEALAADAGFPDTQSFRGAAVFLNGDYYGFEWLEEYFDETWLQNKYGTSESTGYWVILMPKRGLAETDSEDSSMVQATEDIDLLYAVYQNEDLRDDAIFAELSSKLDIENFLQYCAIEIYLANPDWPSNNCKAYRWYSYQDDYTDTPTDGRWRYLLYDLDVGMSRTGSSEPDNPTLGEVLGCVEGNWDRTSYLLAAILRRPDMQERFTEIMEELMEGAFSYEHACEVIDALEEEMGEELKYHMLRFAQDFPEDESAGIRENYELQVARQQEEIEKIREFFRLRPETMREELAKLAEYEDMLYPVSP